MFRKLFISIFLVLTISAQSTSYGVIVGDWEENMDGWSAAWEGSPTFDYSNTGVTSGSWALDVTTNGTGSWVLQRVGLLDLTDMMFELDVTLIASEWETDAWCQLDKLGVNTNLGWREFDLESIIDRDTSSPTDQDWEYTDGDVNRTYSWDLSGVSWSGVTWMAIIVSLESENTAEGFYHLDNARLVPEPSTIILFCIGSLMLIRRRI